MRTPTVFRAAQTIHLLALALWVGAAAMSGIVAAIVFPTMRTLNPTLGAYPDYTGDHSTLAAGNIAGRVFLLVDTVQFVCAATALASLIAMLMLGYSLNTLARVARSVILCIALGILSYHLFVLMPGMHNDLKAYWDAAAIGDNLTADMHKDAFLALHTTASRSIGGTTIAALVAFVLGVWTCEQHSKPTENNA
ncbi:MAG: hypothetical protein KC996_07430 [Phycisphaerales bacterium]|nr:hypothetical protein [Phycisphaerales bacterium]